MPVGEIDPDIAAHADRIQHHFIAADQRIGSSTDAGHNVGRGANIVAGERARPAGERRREDVPDQHAALFPAEIDADLIDAADIMFQAGRRQPACTRNPPDGSNRR